MHGGCVSEHSMCSLVYFFLPGSSGQGNLGQLQTALPLHRHAPAACKALDWGHPCWHPLLQATADHQAQGAWQLPGAGCWAEGTRPPPTCSSRGFEQPSSTSLCSSMHTTASTLPGENSHLPPKWLVAAYTHCAGGTPPPTLTGHQGTCCCHRRTRGVQIQAPPPPLPSPT